MKVNLKIKILLNYLTIHDQICWFFLPILLLFKKFDLILFCLPPIHTYPY